MPNIFPQNPSARFASNVMILEITEVTDMKTAGLIIGFILTSAVIGFGQTPTVTNFELEKFQQKRVAAERDYRENYKRLGFPSPEELDKQREEDMKARLELAEQLRQARLEKERLELERRGLDLDATRLENESESVEYGNGFYGGYYTGFGVSNGFNGNRRFRSGSPNVRFRSNQLLPTVDRRGAYRVTPFGVIQTPQPRPVFRGRIVPRGRHR